MFYPMVGEDTSAGGSPAQVPLYGLAQNVPIRFGNAPSFSPAVAAQFTLVPGVVQENNRLREENARLRQAIHNLINEKANLFHANTRIEERLNSLGKELEEARAENERLMQENAELRRQLDSLGARVAELERVFDERELSRKIEHAILAHLKGAGVSAKVSYLDHVTTALATPGSRRHREVSDAIARLKRTDPWVEDLIDFKTVIQDTKVSANDFAHKNRPKDFRSAFANVLATVTKLDASEYPTKDAFAQWLRDNERSIETLVLP